MDLVIGRKYRSKDFPEMNRVILSEVRGVIRYALNRPKRGGCGRSTSICEATREEFVAMSREVPQHEETPHA